MAPLLVFQQSLHNIAVGNLKLFFLNNPQSNQYKKTCS